MPYFVFKDGKNIFDHLTAPAFKVLFFGSGDNQFEQLKDLQLKIVSISFTEIPEKIFGPAVNFYMLLRPDNHISYIGDLNGCRKFFEKIFVNNINK